VRITTPPSAGSLPPAAFLRPELPDAALHGLPGDITRALAAVTEADPAALLLTTLVLFGNAVGPQPHVEFGGAAHPGRLFALIVGDAATGRKGTAYEAVSALFAEADPDWCDARFQYGLQSPEAMIDRVSDGQTDDCRLMVVETEFARLLEIMARSNMSTQLRNAWDGRALDLGRSNRGKSRRASHAHISLLGNITPAELLKHYARLKSAGGLESRILFAFVTRARRVNPFRSAAIPEELADRLRDVIFSTRQRVLDGADPISAYLCAMRGVQPSTGLPIDPKIVAAWPEIEGRFPDIDRDLGSMFNRAEANVMRLAAIYALADESPLVGMEHIEAAIALWTYCARSAEVIFGIPVSSVPPTINPKHVAKIFDALRSRYPGWVARSYLNDRTFRGNLSGAEIRAMVEWLKLKGHVEARVIKDTGGRPRDEYRLIPSFPVNP
jgi:hypothetical protein